MSGFSFGSSTLPSSTPSFGFGTGAPTTGTTFGATNTTPSFGFGTTGTTFGTTGTTFGNTNNTNNTFGATNTATNTNPTTNTAGFGFGGGGFGFGSSGSSSGFGFGTSGTSSFAAPSSGTTSSLFAAPAPQTDSNSVSARIEKIKQAYDPNSTHCRFQAVFYNKVDAKAVQQYVKPPVANQKLWDAAVKNNPDPQHLVPTLAVGFDDLKKRIQEQEKDAKDFHSTLETISSSLEKMIHVHEATTKLQLIELGRRNAQQAHRLLQLLNRLEVYRSSGVNLLVDEVEYRKQLEHLYRKMNKPGQLSSRVNEVSHAVRVMEERQEGSDALSASPFWNRMDPETQEQLQQLLAAQHQSLEHMCDVLKQDVRDVDAIINHTSTQTQSHLSQSSSSSSHSLSMRR